MQKTVTRPTSVAVLFAWDNNALAGQVDGRLLTDPPMPLARVV
jgi:hypothetical protein